MSNFKKNKRIPAVNSVKAFNATATTPHTERNKKRKKKEFSKILCAVLITLFAICCFLAMVLSSRSYDTSAFMYIIPSTGTTATAAVSFYFFKAKAENLSKQRIRFVLMKVLLEDKLSPEVYKEVLYEIENIDGTIDRKMKDMTEETYNDYERF